MTDTFIQKNLHCIQGIHTYIQFLHSLGIMALFVPFFNVQPTGMPGLFLLILLIFNNVSEVKLVRVNCNSHSVSNSTCSLLLGKLKESLNRGDEAVSVDSAEDGQIRASFAILEVFPHQKACVLSSVVLAWGYSPLDHVALSGEEEKTWQASMNANVPCVSRRHLDGAWKHSCPFNTCLM